MTDSSVTKESLESLPRTERIRKEDETLAANPKQRQRGLLDYIRRGSLKAGMEIMSDLVDLTPKMLEADLIDTANPDFDSTATEARLVETFHQVEAEITAEDS